MRNIDLIPLKNREATRLTKGRHDKIRSFNKRRRKHYQKHQGKRQNYTEIRMNAITDAVASQVAA